MNSYRSPRDWRWWFTIGINPQPMHDSLHYVKPVLTPARLLALGRMFDDAVAELSAAFAPALRDCQQAIGDLGDSLVLAFETAGLLQHKEPQGEPQTMLRFQARGFRP